MITGKPDIIETIKQEGINLTRRGRNYWSQCPFHDEKIPSFMVDPDKQSFHCFGCGIHGDVITFTMEYLKLSFRGAISHLKLDHTSITKSDSRAIRQKDLLAAYRSWLRSFYRHLCKQEQILYSLMHRSRGHPFQDEDIAWEFAELISELPIIAMKLDIIWNGSEEEEFKLFMEENKLHA